jgi:hypothetical protein
LDITIERGTTNRGKYTFPKIPALERKVFAVLVKQTEKYVHATIPDR